MYNSFIHQFGTKIAKLARWLMVKTQCEFNAKDFEADKIKQYKYVREEMARMFPGTTNKVFFGPVQVEVGEYKDENEKKKFAKNELTKIDIGYKRVQNKIKDLRQGYSKAVLGKTQWKWKIGLRILR